MKTSQKQISPNGDEKSTFSQGAFPANRSALQASDLERKTTVRSGRRCCGLYGKYSPLGSLVKTLLESSRWYSPARRLKWDAQTICSRRITFTERNSSSPLMPSVKTLSVRDMPSKRLLFRLVPSEHPTGETGYGLLPTPQTQGLKVCNKDGKTEFLNLELLLTPSASDGLRAGMSMESLKSHKKKNAEQSNLAEQIAHKVGGGTSQLNPLFVAEMMGYPLEWLTLSFLSPNGEVKALKR